MEMVEPVEDRVTFAPAANWLTGGWIHSVCPPLFDVDRFRVSELLPP
jgi:hypothetical protein